MGGVEWQRGTAFGTGPTGSQRSRPGELAHLARELTGAKGGNGRLVIETIAANYVDRSLKHQPRRRVTFTRVEDDFARGKIAGRPAREALGRLDLRRIEDGKHLVVARVDEAHAWIS